MEPYFLEAMQSLYGIYNAYIELDSHVTTFVVNNINMFNEEQLRSLYLIFQEIINIQERIYYLLQHWLNVLDGQHVDTDSLTDIFVEFRFRGHNIIDLLRNIEDRLNIPQNERIPINIAFEV
jgi:hypothetical protein